ncbi:hypothetical protein HOP50_03g25760 [Chloropicon primus]|uniref:Uncharacterized protein n=1 Tax=Chloropicon primus TaxID=1764295 RepID=A0A5B8MHZ3_9CHLO|nr:hypothetical protein A3770_03p25750 [Chloropicon primus]UPQ99269.1 hypothetical protein HOP50_03g25760 [Chloropicon primus]|eukprot:QDZ20057.1 hypothetical protein A3770_03p25750 [Chloropicon primus]
MPPKKGGAGKVARARVKSSFQKGAFAGPDQPSLFECQEIRGKRNLKLTYIWVDMAGVKIISGKSKTVKQVIAFKGIISWEVEDDNFTLKYGNMPNNIAMEKRFVIGFEKAIELKEAIEERVQIAVQRPETAKQLQERAIQLFVGDPIDVDVLAQVPRFGTGSFVGSEATPSETSKKLAKRLSSFAGRTETAQPSELEKKGGPMKAPAVSVESFPCLMLNEAGEVQVDVLLICKKDGMHTVQGTGEDKKVIFVDYGDIQTFIKTKQGFTLKINVDDGFMTLRYKTSDTDAIFTNVSEFAERKIDFLVVEDELEAMVGKVKTILQGTLKQLDEVHTQQDLINLCNVTNRLLTLFKC